MKSTNLVKGRLYFAPINGRINFGFYLGRVPGWRLFKTSDFARDHCDLANGVSDDVFEKNLFIEIPMFDKTASPYYNEHEAFEYLKVVLPE